MSATIHDLQELLKASRAQRERRGAGVAKTSSALPGAFNIADAELVLTIGASHIGDPGDPAEVYRWFTVCGAAHLADLLGPQEASSFLTRLAATALGPRPNGPKAA